LLSRDIVVVVDDNDDDEEEEEDGLLLVVDAVVDVVIIMFVARSFKNAADDWYLGLTLDFWMGVTEDDNDDERNVSSVFLWWPMSFSCSSS
jgi:hypothetical protein